jgi:iron complex outermembrane receptor protein
MSVVQRVRVIASRLRGGGFRHGLGATGLVMAGALGALAQNAPGPAPAAPAAEPATTLPQITVTTVKRTPPKRRVARRPTPTPTAPTTPPTTSPGPTPAAVAALTNALPGQPLTQTPTFGKTNTKLADLPMSVQVVPAVTVREKGGLSLNDAVTREVSGVNVGGSSTYGFFDRYLIRGMDARIYEDGFPDGDQFNGFPHYLNGVAQIEVLKGPGSALFGTSTPGGSINIVHYLPSAVPAWGAGGSLGSFGTVTSNIFSTGPTGITGLSYRLDGLFQHTDGFRGLKGADYELRPSFSWTNGDHFTTFAIDLRHIEATPDLYGIPYFNGQPLNVPRTSFYSTPFGHGNQDIARVSLTDAWTWSDYLTINNRFAYLHRDLDILRNSGGAASVVNGLEAFTSRQLREQTDHDNDFIYLFEPTWKFSTWSMHHTLVTGFSAEESLISDDRKTADLQNIANIFAPQIPETSTAGLSFMCDAAHSCMKDDLSASFLGVYAVDQIDVTDRLKVRLSARQDWWHEELNPLEFVPGRNTEQNTPLEPGMVQTRTDTPFSWSAGALYKLFPGVSPFAGVAKSYLTNYNSEATQSGLVEPEAGIQYEAGVKLTTNDDRFTLTAAAFRIDRSNVFAETNVTVGTGASAVTTTTVFFDDQRNVGFDMDLVFKLTPNWKVTANYINQNAVITAEPNTPTAVGNVPIGVPRQIAHLWTDYYFSIGNVHGFRIAGGMTYSDKSFGNVQNTSFVPAYTVWDTVLSYNEPKWDISAGVKNIFDVTYFPTALSAGGLVGQPRTFFVKYNYHP